MYAAVRDLTKVIEAFGVVNEVVMPHQAQAAAHLSSWAPVAAVCHGRVTMSALQWSPDFGRYVLGSDADILHTHGIWQHPSAIALDWKKRGRPHVASVHGMLAPWAWQHRAWRKRLVWWLWEKRNLQSADLLHATSAQEAEGLRERGLRAPIAIIPNGVDLPTTVEDCSIQDSRFDIQTQQRTALFLSRLHPVKGLPLLLEAWAKVKPENWKLQIVGPDEGGHRAVLERQVSALELGNVVRFSGPLTGAAKACAFQESALFILPTHSENFGIAVAEAMAYELPVITTHGAPWKLLEEEQCGWWVPVSVEGIAAALDDATRKSPEELAAMGERGRAVVAERFDWERIAKQFVECYRWILGEGGKPDCVRQS